MKFKVITAFLCAFISINGISQLKVVSSGNVGIDITPTEKLHINGNIRGDQPSGALKINTSSGYTTIGPQNTTFSHFLTDVNDFYFNRGIRVDYGNIGSYNENLTLKTGPYARMYIMYSNGYVGIGDGSPSYKLDVAGDIATYGVLRISSDERLKKDIVDIDAQKINNLYNLQAKTYIKDNSLLDFGNEITTTAGDTVVLDEIEIDTTRIIGFIAQELMEYFPNLVKQDNKGFYSIDYIALIPVLVEAIKDQQERIVELESRFSAKKSTDIQSNTTSLHEYSLPISTGATLQQNIPNPFNESTIIKYSIPIIESYAMINVYDLQGSQVKSYNVAQTGDGQILIPATELSPGLYIYNLIVDGIEVASKRMVLTE